MVAVFRFLRRHEHYVGQVRKACNYCLVAFCWYLYIQGAQASESHGETPPSYVIADYLNAPGHASLDPNDLSTIVHYESYDANGDGHLDWILYQTGLCGSSHGCEADLYLFKTKAGKFCYAKSGTLEVLRGIRQPSLDCGQRFQ